LTTVLSYQIGVGIADVTGAAAQLSFMGYAHPGQLGRGIHTRQFARAFIIVDEENEGKRVVLVNGDICMCMIYIKQTVVSKLKEKYGDLYTEQNVAISGTHTHSGPGGYSWYVLYDFTTFGFDQQTADAIVNGIVEAISKAHENLASGSSSSILYNIGSVLDGNINRSPTSYEANPEDEKAQYPDGNTDKQMTVFRLQRDDGHELGMFNFYPVHGTSMNNTNRLISSDNKGYAAYLFERYKNGNTSVAGSGPFVAGFIQANEGDVSPNTDGAKCPDGSECDLETSTCDGKNEGCIASGPGEDMFESTYIIGGIQSDAAVNLYEKAVEKLSGPVDFAHMYVNFSYIEVAPEFAEGYDNATTCLAAVGYGFAAGTTDGPGAFNFFQGENETTPFWEWASSILAEPTEEQIKCQAPKPILIDTGTIAWNFTGLRWTPEVLPVQLLRVGQLFIAAVPAEFTTMSGRRLKKVIADAAIAAGVENPLVEIAGLANGYSQYVTTFEEYQKQRYEAASTLFGPWTLSAYMQEFSRLASSILKGTKVPPGPTPHNYTDLLFTFIAPPSADTLPRGVNFGDLYEDVNKTTWRSGEIVNVTFWSGNPRHDSRRGDTFLTVEKNEGSQGWRVVYRDADPQTKFVWHKLNNDGESAVSVEWTVSDDDEAGTYRIRHFGTWMDDQNVYHSYSGVSSTFAVL